MKKLIITSYLLLGVFSYSQTSANSDIPSVENSPYYSSGEVELEAKGYTKSPTSHPYQEVYKAKYNNRTSDYVENLRNNKTNKPNIGDDDTVDKLINSSKEKIDINGGYVRANEAYEEQKDGTLKPKYDVYKPNVNNDEYNKALKTQEQVKTYKSVKKEAKDILPIILFISLIIVSIYLILFLRKRLKY